MGCLGRTRLALGFGVVVIAVATGCSIEPGASSKPTYEADVKPILDSRCIRCHGDPPLGDPQPAGSSPRIAPAGFRFDVFACPADTDASITPCTVGAGGAAQLMKGLIKLGMDVPARMPPPPSLPLTSYQIDTITNWANENPPLER